MCQSKKLYFVLLSLTGTEIARVKICDYYSPIKGLQSYSDLILVNNKYVAAYSSNDSYGELWACLSLITWDGTELHYKNNHLESYNGESLYGIALEDGEAGDTIQVLIPNAPEENTEGE